MSYNLSWTGDTFHKVFTGVVTEAEFLESANRTHSDSKFDALRYAINDFSQVSEFRFTDDTIEEWAALTFGSSFTNRHIDVLFVTENQPIIDAIHNIVDMTLGHYGVYIFASLAEAQRWIDADRKHPRKL